MIKNSHSHTKDYCELFPSLCYENRSIFSQVPQPNLAPGVHKKSPVFPVPKVPGEPQTTPGGKASDASGNARESKLPFIPGKGIRIKPNQSTLTENEIANAKLNNASKIFYETKGTQEKKTAAAQKYLDENPETKQFIIDPETSTDIGLVVLNEETNKVRVAYRGTDVNNSSDVLTDVLHKFGISKYSPEFKYVKAQQEAVKLKYGTPEETTGFSRGAIFAVDTAKELHVPKVGLQQPFLNKKMVETMKDTTETKFTVGRTKGDIASLDIGGSELPANIDLRVYGLRNKNLSALEEHSLVNLTSNEFVGDMEATSSFHPSGIFLGVGLGYASFEEVELLKKLGIKINTQTETGLVGGLTNAEAKAIGARLGGTVASTGDIIASGVSGAGGAIAGYYVGKAVQDALEKKGVSETGAEFAGQAAGGATGGAVTGLLDIGLGTAEVATAAEAGAAVLSATGIGALIALGALGIEKSIPYLEDYGKKLLAEIKDTSVNPYFVEEDYYDEFHMIDSTKYQKYQRESEFAQKLQDLDESIGLDEDTRLAVVKAIEKDQGQLPSFEQQYEDTQKAIDSLV